MTPSLQSLKLGCLLFGLGLFGFGFFHHVALLALSMIVFTIGEMLCYALHQSRQRILEHQHRQEIDHEQNGISVDPVVTYVLG
jgi:hypothetical protein